MLRVPKRGWMPPSRNSSPSSAPIRAAVLLRPSGPAAYETWSRRIASILTTRAARLDTGVALGRWPLVPSRRTGEGWCISDRSSRRRDVAGKQHSDPDRRRTPPRSRTGPTRSATWSWSGPAGSGKTTLVETLLVSAGVLNRAGYDRRRAPRSATSTRPSSASSGRSGWRSRRWCTTASRSTCSTPPGYADFVGELRAGLRAADCAMFVIAANEGVDEPTRTLWRECAEVGMPRVVVVTKLDHARADYDGVVRAGPGGVRGQGAAGLPARGRPARRACITGDDRTTPTTSAARPR